MLVAQAPPRTLGSAAPTRLRFERDVTASAMRRLLLDDRAAFEVGPWCGTCPFLFERLAGANGTLSLDDLADRLATGLRDLDDEVVARFSALLPRGRYVPLLLEIRPRLVRPLGPGDYFAEEQVATWGIDTFWGVPDYTHTPYYRTFETAVDPGAHLYEFVVPMVPPSWNAPARVAAHAERLEASSSPTAVAVTTLDVRAPATEEGPDWYWHWALTHFVLDGHHKLQAAAETRRPLRLLALVSEEDCLAAPEQVARIADLRARPASTRPAVPPG